MSASVKVRPATKDDAEDLYLWRNDPQSRKMSQNGQLISLDNHLTWFHSALCDPNKVMLIGESSDIPAKKIGTCRFDLNNQNSEATVSINMAPHARGRGLSAPLLDAALQYFLDRYPRSVFATVKKENSPSLRLFAGCGFELISEDSVYVYLQRPLSPIL